MSNRDDRRVADVLDKVEGSPSDDHDRAVLAAADRLLGERANPRRFRWHVPLGLAATVLLAVPVGLSMLGETGTDATRGGMASVEPANDSRLDSVPAELRWPPVAGAEGYRVVLRNEAAEVLWTSATVTTPKVALPEAVRAAASQSDRCLWSVDILPADGRQPLGPYWFHLDR